MQTNAMFFAICLHWRFTTETCFQLPHVVSFKQMKFNEFDVNGSSTIEKIPANKRLDVPFPSVKFGAWALHLCTQGSVMHMLWTTKSPTCCGKHSAHLSLTGVGVGGGGGSGGGRLALSNLLLCLRNLTKTGTTKTWWFNLKEPMQIMEKGQIGNAGIPKLMRWKLCLELGWLTQSDLGSKHIETSVVERF